jgi:hypothetical protein
MERTSVEEIEKRYSDGVAKLGEIRALQRNLSAQHTETFVVPHNENSPVQSPAIQKDTSLETNLLKKGRARALEEYFDHQIKAHAFSILAGRYKTLGMEPKADAYGERAKLESATTKGFHAVIEAYDKKLGEAGVATQPIEQRKYLNTSSRSLDSAETFLEGLKAEYATCCEDTAKVLKAEETIKKLDPDLLSRPLTPDERKLLSEALAQRDTFIRMSERDALNAAKSYQRFQSQIEYAEKACKSLNQTNSGKQLPEQTSQNHAPTTSDPRMKRLATGMIICQTLKTLDHEL